MAATDLRVPVAEGVALHVRHRPATAARPTFGTASKPNIRQFLLVHGLSSNARLWDGVADHLAAAGYPSYAVDLRSHGESDAPPEGYDTPTAAADLAALAGRLGLTGLAVAGQSWGGNVVVRFAADRPDLVAGVALIDGGWIDLPAQFASWAACERALRPPELNGQRASGLRRILRRSHPDWSDLAIEATIANLRELPDGRLERRLSIPHHMSIVRSMWDEPPGPLFPRVTAPALLVPAIAKDPATAARRRATVDAAAAALPRATIREYEGADHDLHAQQPDRLAGDLIAFVEQLP
jgi:pimeloyl-ACP methyl ester carboxylesterase